MICRINDVNDIDCKILAETHLGKKILSYLKAYGTDYEFCRFYGDKAGSVLLIINSTLLVSGGSFEKEELCGFAAMHQPFRIEGDQNAIKLLSDMEGYRKLHRTWFRLTVDENIDVDENDIEFNPPLDEVYEILSEGFPNLLEYPLWLTDTSHRIRHGISRVFVYKNSTTASIVYDIDGSVLVGQVATRLSARGSGYARKFLKWLAFYLKKQNKTAYLSALDTRESFYREIGFEITANEYVLEKINNKNESAEKGKLNTDD